ncbi:hypothetical protein EVAR_74140_1 [Eumeta japonica]|uniref:Uncharacterized protein n=1 Tax=Eumeta variegata TaxID=151549 RepID=A0A4C1SVC9_EUMVA|nr:hypothetical protein EVAR_74140_1 [Eumeta japonica]
MHKVSNIIDLNSARLKFKVTESERDHCVKSFLLIHEGKKLKNASKISDNWELSSSNGTLEMQIKEEDNVENMTIDCNNLIAKHAEENEEHVFACNLNESLPDVQDPFESDETEETTFSSNNVQEICAQIKEELPIECAKLDRSKEKRKRKKFIQFANKECMKKKRDIKDIK